MSLAAAAGAGYFAGVSAHRHDPAILQVCDAGGELSEAPPSRVTPPQPVDEIDLTCLPSPKAAMAPQSMEPPLADADAIRTVRFDLPVEAPIGPEVPATMPYITDDSAPAPLPPLGDVPLVPPAAAVAPSAPDPNNPIYQAVKRFVTASFWRSEPSADEKLREKARANQEENRRQAAEDWRRLWLNDPPTTLTKPRVTDKVPIGQPPVSEHSSAEPPEKP
jgi:hypothetical protein